jgi:hypothetical protein
MASKLIKLKDGTLVESQVDDSEARPISGGTADKVASSMDKIEPLLVNICQPVARAWNAISADLQVDSVDIELGLSFEGEGNIFVTKAKAGANFVVRLTLKRSEGV